MTIAVIAGLFNPIGTTVPAADADERRRLQDASGALPAAKGFFDEN